MNNVMIPTLPDHPRFRMKDGVAQFAIHNYRRKHNRKLEFEDIDKLRPFQFESCVSIVRCHFRDLQFHIDPTDNLEDFLHATDTEQAWRLYGESRK